jgi:hypothetical protein
MRVKDHIDEEVGAVTAWRRDQLIAAGFPRNLAAAVARDREFDVHRLIELSELGCPPRVAVRILAPVDFAVEAA